jgi:hypothetical protein
VALELLGHNPEGAKYGQAPPEGGLKQTSLQCGSPNGRLLGCVRIGNHGGVADHQSPNNACTVRELLHSYESPTCRVVNAHGFNYKLCPNQ